MPFRRTYSRVLRAAAFVVAVASVFASRRAFAWQEAHQTGDDVRVRVDAAGGAEVEHSIRWHVVRGPLKWIDLVNVSGAVALEPDVPVTAEDGRSTLGHAVRRDDRSIRITLDEPRALMRGDFVFDVRWRVDLVATRALARDGATWALTWTAPVATDGFDGARTTIDFPAAPDPPQPIVADTGAVDDGAVAALRREPGRDVLELVRPHVARGEAPVWTLRIDPRALALVADPRLRGHAVGTVPAEPDRVREASLLVGLAALALLFALLVRDKARLHAAACAARSATVRALLPLPTGPRAALAGVAIAAAVALEIAGHATAGAACVALATVAAALRAPAGRPAVRGPGRWLALRPDEAFSESARTWTADALAAFVLLVAVAVAGFALRRLDAAAPWLLALDSVALVPLLVTGRASQLPPDGARSDSRWLARAFRGLGGASDVRITPWGRVPLEGHAADELRLLVVPRAAMPGVLGIELGLVWSTTPVGWAPSPELLARVIEGSAAAAKLARDLPGLRALPGRRPDERVVSLLPRAPTRAAAIALARELAMTLTDRRVAPCSPREGQGAEAERRLHVPPPPKATAAAAGATSIAA